MSGGSRPDRDGGLQLRAIDRDELDEVLGIAGQARTRPWSRADFEAELARDHAWVIGAFAPGVARDLLGYLVYWIVAGEQQILDVATRMDARRGGVARALLGYGLAHARRAEVELVTLEVRRGNAPALALYRSLGFEVVGERAGYYAGEGEDALLMTLRLASP